MADEQGATPVKLTEDQKARLSESIENCLTMFHTMSRVWPLQQNIDAARDSILAEVEHMLEFGGES